MAEQDDTQDVMDPAVSEPDRILEIRTNIKAGEDWLKTGNYRKANRRWDFWKRNSEWLRCDWDGEQGDEKTEFHVNNPYANYRTVKPTLVWNTPRASVTAKKPEFQRDRVTNDIFRDDATGQPQLVSDNFVNARLMEVRINHEIEQIKLKDILRRCVGHAKGHYGIGWAKVGHSDKSVASFNNDRNSRSNYWVEWEDPRDQVFDWRATEGQRRRWHASRIVMPRKEVEALGFTLPPGYVGKLPEHILERDQQVGSNTSFKDSPLEYMEFWEYEDLVEGTLDWVLLDGVQEHFFMAETSHDTYPFEGSAHVPLVIDEDDGDLIGLTDIQPVEEQIKALNRMRTREVHHMDNYGTGVVCEESAMPKSQEKKYRRTPYGFLLKVRDGFINKVKIQGTPSMGADHYRMSDVHKEEMRTTLRISDYQQGGADRSRKATEAEIIRSAASIGIEDQRAFVGAFAIEIIERLAAMIQAFDAPLDFYNVANEEFDDDFIGVMEDEFGYNPKTPFLGIPREKIQGEFDFKINLDEMQHQPREVRAAQLQRTLTVVASNQLLMEKFVERKDIDKVLDDLLELNGIKSEKYDKGGAVQIPAVLENEMFRKGMEVPDPHEKDDHSEHQIIHSPYRRELEEEMQGIVAKVQKLQQGLALVPEMMAGNPMQAQEVEQAARAQLNQLTAQADQLGALIRKIKLHQQEHASLEGAATMNAAGPNGAAGLLGPTTGQPEQPPSPADIARAGRPQGGPQGGGLA